MSGCGEGWGKHNIQALRIAASALAVVNAGDILSRRGQAAYCPTRRTAFKGWIGDCPVPSTQVCSADVFCASSAFRFAPIPAIAVEKSLSRSLPFPGVSCSSARRVGAGTKPSFAGMTANVRFWMKRMLAEVIWSNDERVNLSETSLASSFEISLQQSLQPTRRRDNSTNASSR